MYWLLTLVANGLLELRSYQRWDFLSLCTCTRMSGQGEGFWSNNGHVGFLRGPVVEEIQRLGGGSHWHCRPRNAARRRTPVRCVRVPCWPTAPSETESLIRQVLPVCHVRWLSLLPARNVRSSRRDNGHASDGTLKGKHTLPTKSGKDVLESTRSCGAQSTVVHTGNDRIQDRHTVIRDVGPADKRRSNRTLSRCSLRAL